METEELPRKLAAILHADVADYSRLMGEDEDATHRIVSKYLDIIATSVKRYHGNVGHYAGDSVLADFDSAVNALKSAVEIQQEIYRHNDGVVKNKKVEFRIGVNLGDVIFDRGEVYGDGVNVTARLEGLAEPGTVYISESIRNAVGKKLPFTYEFTGEHRVKNIAELIKTYRVCLKPEAELSSGPVEVQNIEKFNSGHRPAIVVLPFLSLNDDIDQQYFCDGLANDLATDLSRFKNLVVVAAQTASTLKNKVTTAREISRDLGVQYLLEGSVQRSAGRIRINAQLIDGTTEHHIWANRFDWSADRLYELQDEIVQSIVVSLSIEVDASERERAMRRERADMGAYDAYMKGFHLWQHHLQDDETLAGLNEVQKWLELAAELDSRFSRPWGMLAYTYVWGWRQWWYGDDILDKADEYLKNAVDLEPMNYDNHWDLAYYYLAIREFELAEREFGVARELNSNDALLLVDTAELYCCMGQHQQALDLVDQAMALNPYYPDYYATSLAWIHYFTRDYQHALELLASVRHNTKEALLVSAAVHAQLSAKNELEQQIELAATQSIKAQEKIHEFLARRQQWTVDREKRSFNFLRLEDEQHWLDGLKKAGLPEQ